jgi:hypothetical protein
VGVWAVREQQGGGYWERAGGAVQHFLDGRGFGGLGGGTNILGERGFFFGGGGTHI